MERWGFRADGGGWLAARALIVSALVAVVAVLAVGAEAGTPRPRFASVQRAPQAPVGAATLGAPAASASQAGFVVLKPRDEPALQSFIASVNRPHSALYHRYLPAGQFESRFGPSSAAIDAVRTQLSAAGLKVTGVARDGLLVGFSGTTTQVERAFATSLERYRSAAGITGELTTRAISLPTSISAHVTAVIGLNTLVHPQPDLVRPPRSAYAGHVAAKTGSVTHYTGAPDPCSDATNDATEFGGLTDDQIANAYGATPLYGSGDTGAGVNIGVYELEPFSSDDLRTFDDCYFGTTQGDALAASITTVPVDGGQPAGPGSGESILDVEDVSAMAPGAQINVYEAPNTNAGSLDEYARMVDDDTDQIITSSWGLCEQDLQQADPGAQQAENYIFEQAAAQGQTVLSAAGDTGDDTCNEGRDVPPPSDQNPLSVGDPASQPYVLGVGGTTIDDADPANYNETVWNDGAEWGGGGGGLSESWAGPSWQQSLSYFSGGAYGTDLANAYSYEHTDAGLVSDQHLTPNFCTDPSGADLPTGTVCRGVPDVAAQADEFTGAVTIYMSSQDGWSTIGGTSSATPIWAAMLALVDASSACSTSTVQFATSPTNPALEAKPDIGFASPLLYAVAANSTEYAESFHDIAAGNNDVFGFDNGLVFPARSGYDLATGLGSPILAGPAGSVGLATNLCNLATGTTATPAITGLSSDAGPVTGGGSLTVSGTGFVPGGDVTVKSVSVGAAVIPATDLTSISGTSLTLTLPAASATLAPAANSSSTDPDTGTNYTTAGSTTDGAGLANIAVTLSNGVSSAVYANDPSASRYDQYSYVDEDSNSDPEPSISSISPYAGVDSGGTQITIYGSGFVSGDTVTVGNAATTGVTVVSPWEITATTSADSSPSTNECVTNADLDSELGVSTSHHQWTTDICQTEVVVTAPNSDTSTVTAPVPTYLGLLPLANQDGLLEVPLGYELTPVADEFDYVAAPQVDSVQAESTLDGDADADPSSYGSPTVLAVTGAGLNYQTMNWFSFGDPTQASSQDTTYPAYADGSIVELTAPTDAGATLAAGSDADVEPVTVTTMGGSSATPTCPGAACLTYAGLPEITSVRSASNTDGYGTSPDTGGSAVTIHGHGLSDVVAPLDFVDAYEAGSLPPFSIGTQYTFDPMSDSQITTETVSQNPALVYTSVCSDSGCWPNTADQAAADGELLLYPPGDPVITSVQDASGPALGGTLVTINGRNLGCVTSVGFGSTVADSFSNTEALLDCGSSSQLTVVAPPGVAGQSVPITVTTIESDATGDGAAVSPADFSYDPANPNVTGSVSFGSINLGSSSNAAIVTISNPASATQPLDPEPDGAPDANGDQDPVDASISGGEAGDFSIAADGCTGQTLTPGQSCNIQVRFTPSQLGTRSATLEIPWNNSTSVAASYGDDSLTGDFAVALSGTGAEPTVTNTVTIPGTSTTVAQTITQTVTCTITVRSKWVTVKVHGKKRREYKKVTTRSKGCPKAAKKAAKPTKKRAKPPKKRAKKRRGRPRAGR